jgi:hypothetical protein
MFYSMHVLTIIITCTFLAELEVQENNFGSYMRTGVMEDAQGILQHEEEEVIGLHVNMEMVRQILMEEETERSLWRWMTL